VQLGHVNIANSEELPLPGDNRLLFHRLGFAVEKIGRRFRLKSINSRKGGGGKDGGLRTDFFWVSKELG
jgi:hypothetical protein